MALVGSHARKEARADSDIDLVLLAEDPDKFRDASSLTEIRWAEAGLLVYGHRDEKYGAAWSRRVWFRPVSEIEFTFVPLSWAEVSPLDGGTGRVISGGCLVLLDPDGLLSRLKSAVAALSKNRRRR